jgi:hypothetical protein
MIIWIVSSILIVLLLISLAVNRNLYIQNVKYEDFVEQSSSEFFNILDDTRNKISDALLYMRELDQREMFEKDDEVGVVFVEITNIIEKLNEELKIYDEETKSED